MNFLFTSNDFIAVEKPAGLSVHNAEDDANLLSLLQQNYTKIYPVHRLDKETSGVQILALNESRARQLAGEFQSRNVKKIYVGVLRGQLTTQIGLWNKPLSDKSEGQKNPQGLSKDRVPCETKFKVLKQSKYFSLCEFDLITGRQHQIRKHCALSGHHLVGDNRYGDRKYNQKISQIYKTDRMFLHCLSVEIAGHKIISPMPEEFNLDFAKEIDL